MNTELEPLRLAFTLHPLLIARVLGSMLVSLPARAATPLAACTPSAARADGICSPALRGGVACP